MGYRTLGKVRRMGRLKHYRTGGPPVRIVGSLRSPSYPVYTAAIP